jgi:glycerol-3-phosphate responsive antiterminator
VLIASDGRHPVYAPPGFAAGVLVRDTDLNALVHRVASDCPPFAVDLDSVAGLGSDEAAVEFVTGRLGIRVVMTRRPQLAQHATRLGHLGLVHILAYDSTGMARSLEGHPGTAGIGCVLSPGLVIAHLRADELADLPRPIVAYGLIADEADARVCQALADTIVVRPALAARLAAEELVAT